MVETQVENKFDYDKLFSYQKEDLERLLVEGRSFLNLSEMGTGKTPVSIGLSVMGGYRSVLILCPKSLKYEWSNQIKDWFGEEATISKRGSSKRLDTLFINNTSRFFILNYETFRKANHRDILCSYPFDLIIMDEIHRMRNPRTKMVKGLLEFLDYHTESRVIGMTGSPIVNNPADLHTILCMIAPDRWTIAGRFQFINEFCYYRKTRFGYKVFGVKDMDILRKLTLPYTIRHTKKEVLPFLPDKYTRRVVLKMDPEQRKVYESMEQTLKVLLDTGEPLHAPNVLAELMRLRQINLDPKLLGINATSSKTTFVLSQVEDFQEAKEKLVIFSCFESYITLLCLMLNEKGIPYLRVTGKETDEQINDAVDKFQNKDGFAVILGTVQKMGEGITLTAASNVLMTDLWWTPTTNDQAVDRLHRISQKNAVQIIRPINERSVDAIMDKIIGGKAVLSSAYLGDQMMMEEILEDLRTDIYSREYEAAKYADDLEDDDDNGDD